MKAVSRPGPSGHAGYRRSMERFVYKSGNTMKPVFELLPKRASA